MKPFINVSKNSGTAGGWSALFGIRLMSCVAERGEREQEIAMTEKALRKQVDFINALFSAEGNRSFALRYISRPHNQAFSAGSIDVVLFGKIAGKQKARAARSASDLCRETAGLLSAAMPNHVWQIVAEADQFAGLWRPFTLEKASVVEIRRREDSVSLATLRKKSRMGFGPLPGSAGKPPTEEDAVYLVHHFLPQPSTFGRLLRTMLLHRWPLLLQILLKPTQLAASEMRALEDQMTRCEQSQRGIFKEEPGDDPIIHSVRAREIYGDLFEQSIRLKDAPYLLQISLASPRSIPLTIAEAVGVDMTRPLASQPMASDNGNVQRHLDDGGYDVAFPADKNEILRARHNLAGAETQEWGATSAPEKLRRLRHMVDAGEAAAAFRFPIPAPSGLDGIEVRVARFRAQPLELARVSSLPEKERVALGENISLGLRQPVFMTERDRRQHTYIIGQTGTGKTSLLRSMILADIKAGKGLAVLDPHGDLFQDLLGRIPRNRQKDIVLLDPVDRQFITGLNLLECRDEEERHFVVREMRSIMERILADQYGHSTDLTGPAFYQHMQMNMLLAMSNPDDPGTLVEFYEIFQQKDYWKRWLPLRWNDPQLSRWAQSNLPRIDYLKRGSDVHATWGEYLSAKFEDFVFDPRLRLIFGQKRSTIDLRRIMDEGKVLLINLAKGSLTESNSRFLGMALLAKIQAAAMSRSDMPVAKRRTFYLYVDEFQSMATENFISLLSEGRKFGLALVLANQFLSQVKEQRIMQSVTGNVGTHICFRVGREDAKLLEPQFAPHFDQFDLSNLPNWNACVRTTVGGQVVAPFSLSTVLPPDDPDETMARKIRTHSRERHSRPRKEVEAEIQRSIAPNVIAGGTKSNGLLERVEEIIAGKV